ncbi:hypothetical protein FBU30_009172 [Linnemannia zychae]|nr:hypothetical protein FBU30_009172 [Linnemannia zychae]
MRFDITILAFVAFIAPSVLAASWNVTFADGKFSPQELDIAPGDTVVWPNTDGAEHAIVETNPGPRSCDSKPAGFNSGRKMNGQAYQRTFPAQAVVNYKDGIGANCAKGATGTIFVGPRPATDPNAGNNSTTTTTTATTGAPTQTTTPMTTPTPTHTPSSAMGLSASENILVFGALSLVGAFMAL